MKLIGIVSTAVLSLSLGAIPGYAQQEQHDQQEEQKEKPAEQKEKKAQPEKPAKPQEEKNAKPEEKSAREQDKNAKPEEKSMQQQDKNAKPEEKSMRQEDRNSKPEQKNAQQHVQPAAPERQAQGGGGGRIPADRYQANFGREHTFRVTQGDYSNHRFQYGGYWFGFADPWPSNWLYTQDVFVVDINGVYYLCNPMYPGVNIALNITL